MLKYFTYVGSLNLCSEPRTNIQCSAIRQLKAKRRDAYELITSFSRHAEKALEKPAADDARDYYGRPGKVVRAQ